MGLFNHGAGRALGSFRSWVILARMVPAGAPGVLLDGRQGGIKGYEGARLDTGHSLPRMAIWVDCELLGGCFRDPAHGAAEQVRQGPCGAVVCWCHGYIQACLRSRTAQETVRADDLTTKACNCGVFPCALSFAGIARIGDSPAAFGYGTAAEK